MESRGVNVSAGTRAQRKVAVRNKARSKNKRKAFEKKVMAWWRGRETLHGKFNSLKKKEIDRKAPGWCFDHVSEGVQWDGGTSTAALSVKGGSQRHEERSNLTEF